ncbi:uncharacterized protein LOC118609963 isoform X7 [Rousettus aegyptiacus]|uniref:uncharacterized protein LOC118609963 isoform X7 n=1 Tax=Rousettus aegyptiacus TaxID=9407 RepID=UPI00168D7DDF|nr:uncharacterized protein LOC118609963 isoform X7 [Rousettus aegyptiacus]
MPTAVTTPRNPRQPGRHDPSASESVASAAVGHHRSSEKRLSRRRPAPCTRLAAPGFDKSLGITETRKSCKLRPRVRPGCRRGRCLGSPSQQISGRRGELLCLRPSTRPQAPEKATSFPGSFCIEKKDQIRRKRKEKNSFSHIQYRKNKRLLFLRIFWSVVEF